MRTSKYLKELQNEEERTIIRVYNTGLDGLTLGFWFFVTIVFLFFCGGETKLSEAIVYYLMRGG